MYDVKNSNWLEGSEPWVRNSILEERGVLFFKFIFKLTLPVGTRSDRIVYSDVSVNSHCSQSCYTDGHRYHSQVIRKLAWKIMVENVIFDKVRNLKELLNKRKTHSVMTL